MDSTLRTGRRSAVLIAALALAASLSLAGTPAAAANHSCGGLWTAPGDDCIFIYQGGLMDITVTGIAIGPVAVVNVVASDRDGFHGVQASCFNTGFAVTGCSQTVTGITSFSDDFDCRVQGTVSGAYSCEIG